MRVSGTRGAQAFLKKTAIAYHQNSAFLLGFGRYAIAVFFKNASTSRVFYTCPLPSEIYHGIISIVWDTVRTIIRALSMAG